MITEHPWLHNAKKAPNVPLGDIVRPRLKQFSVMNRFKKKALRVSIYNWYFMSAAEVLATIAMICDSQTICNIWDFFFFFQSNAVGNCRTLIC